MASPSSPCWGIAGDGGRVRAAQAAYATPLLAREAAQLRALETAGIRVGRCAGYRRGVLFTEAVTGPNLLDLITKEPARTGALMTGAVRGLAALQSPAVVAAVDAAPIAERGIDTTFRRTFNGIPGPAYLARLGVDQLDERTRRAVVAVLAAVVARLLKLRLTPAPGPHPVVYGDLKPEHILYPDGPDQHPVFIDPGLSRGGAHLDTATSPACCSPCARRRRSTAPPSSWRASTPPPTTRPGTSAGPSAGRGCAG